MSRQSRIRAILAIVFLVGLAALLLLAHNVEDCAAAGGRFDWRHWTCTPLPRIHIERDLQRS